MNKPISTLSDDEVRQIALLVESLEKSTFDFLQLELGDLKLTIGKGAPSISAAPGVTAASPSVEPRSPAAPPPAPAPVAAVSTPVAAPPAPAQAAKDEAPAPDGTVAIVAPMMGRFYAKPEPGAAPFVSAGAEVNIDTTVALIEVMKVFTAVRAGMNGVITEICVQNEQFIEYGQVLFRVRPIQRASAPAAAGAKGSRKGSRA